MIKKKNLVLKLDYLCGHFSFIAINTIPIKQIFIDTTHNAIALYFKQYPIFQLKF
jgi:hypothetical protein